MSGHAATTESGQVTGSQNYVWDTLGMAWVRMTQPGGTGGTGYETVWLKDVGGSKINPATEETLAKLPGLSIPIHDYIGATYPDGVTEVYTYRTGGGSGTIVATVTVIYTDVTKATLSSVAKA